MNKRDSFEPQELVPLVFFVLGLMFFMSALTANLSSNWKLLLGEIGLVIPLFLILYTRNFHILKTIRLNRISSSVLLSTIFLFLPVYILIDELDRIILTIFPIPNELMIAFNKTMQYNSLKEAIILLIIGAVVAAVCEEILFRGVIQRSLEIHREPASAIVYTSVLFAIIHFNPWSAVQLILLGLVLGFVTWKSASIIPAVLIHGLNNFCSIILLNTPSHQLEWYLKNNHVRIHWIFLAIIFALPLFRIFIQSCTRR